MEFFMGKHPKTISGVWAFILFVKALIQYDCN